MTKKWSRREMVGTVIRATAGVMLLPTGGLVAGCISGFEPIGEPIPGDDQSVHEATLRRLGYIYWVDRRWSGWNPDGSKRDGGPRIVEIKFFDSSLDRGPGEYVYMIDGDEIYHVGAHRYDVQPHQSFQWHWAPLRRDMEKDELTEKGMPRREQTFINQIEESVGFNGEVD